MEHCICGTPGWELYGETAKQQKEEDLCFQKPTFPSLELADYLAEEEFVSVELVGLVSHMCVLSNAVMAKAAAPEAEIIVDAACTASFDPKLHERSSGFDGGAADHSDEPLTECGKRQKRRGFLYETGYQLHHAV